MAFGSKILQTVIGLGLLILAPGAFAESECSGPTYANPFCSSACPLEDCQDVSFGQDGTLFQCCPPATAVVPELPGGMGPLGLVAIFLLLVGLGWVWKRRHQLRG